MSTTSTIGLGECPRCGRVVPEGNFCVACGVDLRSLLPRRHETFAASPDEHVLRLRLTTTVLPHVPSRDAAPFRAAFGVLAALLVVLGAIGRPGPAIVTAALALPLLYVAHIYAVGVHGKRPWGAVTTAVVAAAAGTVWAHLFGERLSNALLLNSILGITASRFLLYGVAVPLVGLAAMLLVPVVVEAVDRGDALAPFTLGIISALAFTAARTFVELCPEIHNAAALQSDRLAGAVRIVDRGFVTPLVYAGAVATAAMWVAWSQRRAQRDAADAAWVNHPVAATLAGMLLPILTIAGTGIVSTTVARSNIEALVDAAILGGVIVYARVSLHFVLLDTALDVEAGPEQPCPHCHRVVPHANFCPHCGIANVATPNVVRSRPLQGSTA